MRFDLWRAHVGLKVQQIFGKNSGPNHVYRVDIWYPGTALEKAPPRGQCLHRSLRRGHKLNSDSGLLCELVQFLVSPVLELIIQPGLIAEHEGDCRSRLDGPSATLFRKKRQNAKRL